jgi:MoxR-like ATPase
MSSSLNSPAIAQPHLQRLAEPIGKWLFGLDEPLQYSLIALMCGGHILYEGPPGTAKTLLVKLIAQSMNCPFKRVQFTPDVMPADIIGTNIFNQEKNGFQFSPGPLFTTFLLADEINRAPAKTQSALLECMQEYQVTVDGKEHQLSPVFTVFATQNPLEQEGTYPLPEAQLDRFLFKILFEYPAKADEVNILRQHHKQRHENKAISVPAVLSEQDILDLREQANQVEVQDGIINYVAELAEQSREHPSLAVGASPSAAVMWIKAAKAKAFLEGRQYVIPDDVKKIAKPLLRHRLIPYPQAELEGRTIDSIIDDLFLKVLPPR